MNFEFVNDDSQERSKRFRPIDSGSYSHSVSFGRGSIFYHQSRAHVDIELDEPDDASVLIGDDTTWIYLDDCDWQRFRDNLLEAGVEIVDVDLEPEENISD